MGEGLKRAMRAATNTRLTKPQRDLLDQLPCTVAESYPPAKKLVALGLAEWRQGKWGSMILEPVNSQR